MDMPLEKEFYVEISTPKLSGNLQKNKTKQTFSDSSW